MRRPRSAPTFGPETSHDLIGSGWAARGPVVIPSNDPVHAAAMLIALCAWPEATADDDINRDAAVHALEAAKWQALYRAREGEGRRNKGLEALRRDGGDYLTSIPQQQIDNRLRRTDARLVRRFHAALILAMALMPLASQTAAMMRGENVKPLKANLSRAASAIAEMIIGDDYRARAECNGATGKPQADFLIRDRVKSSAAVIDLAAFLRGAYIESDTFPAQSPFTSPSLRLMMEDCTRLVASAQARLAGDNSKWLSALMRQHSASSLFDVAGPKIIFSQ